ncbi:reverse transcriptase domain-containing protein [Tanacetum coccineum]
MLVRIGKFVFLINFIILDILEDDYVPLILGRPFLSTAHVKIDVFKRKATLRVGEEKLVFKRTESRLRPYHFIYPERSLTMEEMLNKFIDEGKREHEEMRAFIYDFQTTNELLGGKTTLQDVHDNDTNVLPKEPLVVELEKQVGSNEVLTNDQPQMTSEPVVQPSNKVQTPPVPFPRRLRKEKEEAQQKKFLENLKQLHINLPFIEALARMPKYAKFLKGYKPFLHHSAMIDVFNKKITLRVGDDEYIFDVDQSIKRPTTKDDEYYGIDDLDDTINEEAQELLANEESDSFLSRGLEKSIDQLDLECYEFASNNENDGSDSKNSIQRYIPSANEIDEKKPELKNLPQHLEYAYLHGDKSFPIIISSELSKKEKISLLQLLDRGCASITVNLMMQLEKTIFLFFSLTKYYCFLDGFLGFFQIPITSKDQEKTTFTCPYRTFAYRQMSFGLYNAPVTFQRCMTTIFHDMVEDFMKVFMDDFSVFGNSFDCCIANLDRMLARCEETNLVLNWEKCHFMIKEGIVLGHKISRAGIEVDRAKCDS